MNDTANRILCIPYSALNSKSWYYIFTYIELNKNIDQLKSNNISIISKPTFNFDNCRKRTSGVSSDISDYNCECAI